MSEQRHTPGPWHVNIWTTGRRTIEAGKLVICEVHPTHNAGGIAANARLIAAAPEMLAACRDVEHALIERSRSQPGVWDGALATLQTAISKAEGRA